MRLTLTNRESYIHSLVLEGWTDREIAKDLDLRPATIAQHRLTISIKLGRYDQPVDRRRLEDRRWPRALEIRNKVRRIR